MYSFACGSLLPPAYPYVARAVDDIAKQAGTAAAADDDTGAPSLQASTLNPASTAAEGNNEQQGGWGSEGLRDANDNSYSGQQQQHDGQGQAGPGTAGAEHPNTSNFGEAYQAATAAGYKYSTDKDEYNPAKIFVGNLLWSTTVADLRSYFQQRASATVCAAKLLI